MSRGPVLIDLDEDAEAAHTPSTAPAIVDAPEAGRGAAMQQVAALAARRPSVIGRWFWSLLLSLLGIVVTVATVDYVTSLLDRFPLLGLIVLILLVLFCCVLLALAIRELSALARLGRVDRIQAKAAEALTAHDLKAARAVVDDLRALYKGRDAAQWGLQRLKDREGDVLDADGLLGLAERTLLEPLDARAVREVEAAARQVATVTAVVPLALADVFTALTANLRMIRRIAEVYEGRSGTIGAWRLTRSVLTHLVATGAVAVGDDLIGSVAGGGVLSKVSRRFGEGVINGALTARVGVAAIEVCRPLPFTAVPRPSVSALVSRALAGLFGGLGR